MSFLTLSHNDIKNFKRPSLVYDMINGKTFWTAITFESHLDRFDICKSFKNVTLSATLVEHWKFYDAQISSLDDKFVMIFVRCERIVRCERK